MESLQAVEAMPQQAMPPAINVIKARLAYAMVCLGIVVTIVWSGSLAWLLLWLLDVI
jgi:hypothetical protein